MVGGLRGDVVREGTLVGCTVARLRGGADSGLSGGLRGGTAARLRGATGIRLGV